MYYWMMTLEEVLLPINKRGCMVEEQVSEEFSKSLAEVVRKTGGKGLLLGCKLPWGERLREEARRLATSLQQWYNAPRMTGQGQ